MNKSVVFLGIDVMSLQSLSFENNIDYILTLRFKYFEKRAFIVFLKFDLLLSCLFKKLSVGDIFAESGKCVKRKLGIQKLIDQCIF